MTVKWVLLKKSQPVDTGEKLEIGDVCGERGKGKPYVFSLTIRYLLLRVISIYTCTILRRILGENNFIESQQKLTKVCVCVYILSSL